MSAGAAVVNVFVGVHAVAVAVGERRARVVAKPLFANFAAGTSEPALAAVLDILLQGLAAGGATGLLRIARARRTQAAFAKAGVAAVVAASAAVVPIVLQIRAGVRALALRRRTGAGAARAQLIGAAHVAAHAAILGVHLPIGAARVAAKLRRRTEAVLAAIVAILTLAADDAATAAIVAIVALVDAAAGAGGKTDGGAEIDARPGLAHLGGRTPDSAPAAIRVIGEEGETTAGAAWQDTILTSSLDALKVVRTTDPATATVLVIPERIHATLPARSEAGSVAGTDAGSELASLIGRTTHPASAAIGRVRGEVRAGVAA